MSKLLSLLDTKPGTLADDIAIGIALVAMLAVTYGFWVATP